jgi:hypothetical protein
MDAFRKYESLCRQFGGLRPAEFIGEPSLYFSRPRYGRLRKLICTSVQREGSTATEMGTGGAGYATIREDREAEVTTRPGNRRAKTWDGRERAGVESGTRLLDAGLAVGRVRLPGDPDSAEFRQRAGAVATRQSEAAASTEFLRMRELGAGDFALSYHAKFRLAAKSQGMPGLQAEKNRQQFARMWLLDLGHAPTPLQIRVRDPRWAEQFVTHGPLAACGPGRRAGKRSSFLHADLAGPAGAPASCLGQHADPARRAIRLRRRDARGHLRAAGARDELRLRLRSTPHEFPELHGGAGRFHRGERVQSLQASFLKK